MSRRATGSRFGPFDLEFVAVNHSIPDALAVAIRTGAGMVLHTGDFKMDQLPLDGRITDLRAFARLGEEGVDLFLTDSTNAEVPGFTTSEKDIAPGPRPGLPQQRASGSSSPASPPTCTASSRCSTPRPSTAARSAYVGRSMVRNMGIARDLGYLHVPPGLLVDAEGDRRHAAGPGGADLHRLPGRAAVGAEPDRPAQPQLRAHRGGRHRRPRLAR